VLYVRDADRAERFYQDVLGFRTVTKLPGAAFLQAAGSTNDHDLGLFAVGPRAADSPAGRGSVGLYHLAWEVDTLAELGRLRALLADVGALVGASDHGTTKALYARDPDGNEFEVCWLVPADALTDAARAGATGRPRPLDIDAEIERYGADTRGGVGVSVSA
jgi:catechol-2,3-dioxygenase